jgi:hypothetical protein
LEPGAGSKINHAIFRMNPGTAVSGKIDSDGQKREEEGRWELYFKEKPAPDTGRAGI